MCNSQIEMGNFVTLELRKREPAPPRDIVVEPLQHKAQRVSDCMLEQYLGTAAGVGIGLAMGIQRKNIRPFVVGVTLGTLGDYLSGYYGPCRELREDYEAALKADNEEKERKKKEEGQL